jgi:hypothetical protein
MKRLMVVWMAVAFIMAAIMGGCSTTQPFSPKITGTDQGMTKPAWDMPKPAPSGTITGSDQGMTKQPFDMPKPAPSGTITGSDQGMTKPSVQWPLVK